jgi:hypothetical protein
MKEMRKSRKQSGLHAPSVFRFEIPPDINHAVPLSAEELVNRVRAKSGLTYKFLTSEVRLVKHILESNGFIDVDETKGPQPLI